MPDWDDRRIRLGVVANEFFHRSVGPMGGFGWVAASVAAFFNSQPSLGVDAVFLAGTGSPYPGVHATTVHGVPLVFSRTNVVALRRALRKQRIDLLLSVDYRPSYRRILYCLPRTPWIMWVHDPRTPDDQAKIDSLRIPGIDDQPFGIQYINCTSLPNVLRASAAVGRRVLFATPAPDLIEKMPGTYNLERDTLTLLPNVIPQCSTEPVKSPQPRVVFLGRLDPIKRPWIFLELARYFPEVEFLFLGQAHGDSSGMWRPSRTPSNVRFMGHLDGDGKLDLLSSAWALVNTSIHEALAISFLEALAVETPLVSSQDPERVASRFGAYVGRWDGDGRAGIDAFRNGLQRILSDEKTRRALGKEGRRWVEHTHSHGRFVEAFRELASMAGVTL